MRNIFPRSTVALVASIAILTAACGGDDAVSADDLDGRSFVATELTGATIVEGSEIVIEFEDGRVAVLAGCNTQNGSYEIDGDTLVASGLVSTMMACDEPLMAQDTLLAGMLAAGPTVELDGDQLTLSTDANTLTLVER